MLNAKCYLILFIVSNSASFYITASSIVSLEENTVGSCQLGSGAGVGVHHGGVEDTQEPDDKTYDALRPEARVILFVIVSVGGGGGRGGCGDIGVRMQVGFAVQAGGAVDSRPGEVHDVEADHGTLQQPGPATGTLFEEYIFHLLAGWQTFDNFMLLPWHVLLDLGKHRDHGEANTNQHVEGNEELMDLALANIVSSVVDKHEDQT